MNVAVTEYLLELLQSDAPTNLTDVEMAKVRAWLDAAQERALRESRELDRMTHSAPVEPVVPAPVPVKQKPSHPSDEAVAALYARLDWFFAKREVEMEQRARVDSSIIE